MLIFNVAGCGSTGQKQLQTRSSCSTAPSSRCLSLTMTSLQQVIIVIVKNCMKNDKKTTLEMYVLMLLTLSQHPLSVSFLISSKPLLFKILHMLGQKRPNMRKKDSISVFVFVCKSFLKRKLSFH